MEEFELNSLCTFCSKDGCFVERKSGKRFIKHLSHYLKSSQLTTGQLSLCEPCFKTVCNFCDLYREWEEVRLELQWTLQVLFEKMKLATTATRTESNKTREEIFNGFESKLDLSLPVILVKKEDGTVECQLQFPFNLDNDSDDEEEENEEEKEGNEENEVMYHPQSKSIGEDYERRVIEEEMKERNEDSDFELEQVNDKNILEIIQTAPEGDLVSGGVPKNPEQREEPQPGPSTGCKIVSEEEEEALSGPSRERNVASVEEESPEGDPGGRGAEKVCEMETTTVKIEYESEDENECDETVDFYTPEENEGGKSKPPVNATTDDSIAVKIEPVEDEAVPEPDLDSEPQVGLVEADKSSENEGGTSNPPENATTDDSSSIKTEPVEDEAALDAEQPADLEETETPPVSSQIISEPVVETPVSEQVLDAEQPGDLVEDKNETPADSLQIKTEPVDNNPVTEPGLDDEQVADLVAKEIETPCSVKTEIKEEETISEHDLDDEQEMESFEEASSADQVVPGEKSLKKVGANLQNVSGHVRQPKRKSLKCGTCGKLCKSRVKLFAHAYHLHGNVKSTTSFLRRLGAKQLFKPRNKSLATKQSFKTRGQQKPKKTAAISTLQGGNDNQPVPESSQEDDSQQQATPGLSSALESDLAPYTNRFTCHFEGCGKAFAKSSTLFHHGLTHKHPKPYQCWWPGCRTRFAHQNSLTPHLKRKHNATDEQLKAPSHPCRFCKRVFPTHTRLGLHLSDHGNSEPESKPTGVGVKKGKKNKKSCTPPVVEDHNYSGLQPDQNGLEEQATNQRGPPKRGRGRPRKLGRVLPSTTGFPKRGRGRPRKLGCGLPSTTGPPKRGRGRPPKTGPPKRGRGRPRKLGRILPSNTGLPKRGRGRPPKLGRELPSNQSGPSNKPVASNEPGPSSVVPPNLLISTKPSKQTPPTPPPAATAPKIRKISAKANKKPAPTPPPASTPPKTKKISSKTVMKNPPAPPPAGPAPEVTISAESPSTPPPAPASPKMKKISRPKVKHPDNPEFNAYQCLWQGCTARFPMIKFLKAHMDTEHEATQCHYNIHFRTCPVCQRFFSNYALVSKHLTTHPVAGPSTERVPILRIPVKERNKSQGSQKRKSNLTEWSTYTERV